MNDQISIKHFFFKVLLFKHICRFICPCFYCICPFFSFLDVKKIFSFFMNQNMIPMIQQIFSLILIFVFISNTVQTTASNSLQQNNFLSFFNMNYIIAVKKRSHETYQLLKETKEKVKHGKRTYYH